MWWSIRNKWPTMAGRIKRPPFLLHIPETFLSGYLYLHLYFTCTKAEPQGFAVLYLTVVSLIMTRLGLNAYGKIFDELW
jgi:hypothetical protein